MNGNRSRWTALSAALLLVLLVPIVAPSGAAQGLPEITVEVEDVGDVKSDPVEFNHVTVKATITADNFIFGTTVNVNATTNNYWLVTVSTTTIEVPQGNPSHVTTNINVDVRVPPGADAGRPVTLTVFANATGPPPLYNPYEGSDTTEITIEQFYGLRATSNATIAVEQGENTTHRIRVTNTGNGPDNLTVALTNKAAVTNAGVSLGFDEEIFEVGPARTVSILVNVGVDKEATLGDVDAVFRVASKGDPTQSVSYTLTIRVDEGTGGNGGNGGNGNGDDDDGGLIGFGAIIAVVSIVAIAIFFAGRRIGDRGLEE